MVFKVEVRRGTRGGLMMDNRWRDERGKWAEDERMIFGGWGEGRRGKDGGDALFSSLLRGKMETRI